MNPRVIALAGPSTGKTFGLTTGEFSIGRDPANSLFLNDPLISRKHAAIRTTMSGIVILDLNSRNGTFVNAVPVAQRKLEPGDRIQIGDSLLLFVIEEEDAAGDSSHVRFDETVFSDHSVIQLHKHDSLYLNPQKTSAVTERMARDFKTLLKISTEISSLRGQESLQRYLLELLFDSVPADSGAILLFEGESNERCFNVRVVETIRRQWRSRCLAQRRR